MMKSVFAFAVVALFTVVSTVAPAAAGTVCPKPLMGKEYIPGTCIYQRANGFSDSARSVNERISRDKAEKASKSAAQQAARDAARAERATRTTN